MTTRQISVLRADWEKVVGVPLSVWNAVPKRDLNMNMWTAMVSISLPLLGYVGYKTYRWVQDMAKEQELAYEYYYQEELDQLMETKLDDLENPHLANQDTIKVDSKLYSLKEFFTTLPRNYRKRLVRKAEHIPIVKKVPVPYEEFDWQNSYTQDETPRGKIFMRYEPNTESFWYYTNDKSIPYKYLEAVARKYVCEHNRLDVFIDIREELRKGAEALQEATSKPEEEENVNQKTVYAKFKKYNRKNARASNSSKKQMVVKARANRYSYRGTIEDFEQLVTGDTRETSANAPENVSYSEYLASLG